MTRLAQQAPTAAALAADVRAGRTDPVELVERALARIAECDGELGAFVLVDIEGARQQARGLAGQEPAGPLFGVPVAVKDLYDVAGQVSRAGSQVPPGPAAERDSTAVARLRAAGAVVVGRTRTHEFAWGITTQHARLGGAGNPYDPARTPGGSSGGSAAAVAAAMVPLALGTDTGCSVRLPAAWCGLVGHKPTHGAVPLDGVVPLAPSMDTGGVLVRDVADTRLALGVLGVALPPPAPLAGLRLGVVGERPEVLDAAARSGLATRPLQLPLADRLEALYALVQGPEALAWHRGTGRWPAHAEAYGPDVRSYLERFDRLPEQDAERSRADREQLRALVAQLWEQVDLLVLPMAACDPPLRDGPSVRGQVLPHTVLANLCGLPACSVPAGTSQAGLPRAVQVVGPPGADGRVLDLAAVLGG